MTSVNTATQVDEGKLNAFIGQMLNDLGGASSIAMVRMGDALGLYKELHTKGPMTSAELASSAKVDPRYLREWLSNQASSNYLSYDPASAKFTLTPEQAMVFAVPESPVYLMGGFDLVAALPGAIRPAACSARWPVFSGPAITTTSYAHGFLPCPAAC